MKEKPIVIEDDGIELRITILSLLRLGVDLEENAFPMPDSVDWKSLKDLATRQGLFAIVFDGIEKLPQTSRPPLAASAHTY